MQANPTSLTGISGNLSRIAKGALRRLGWGTVDRPLSSAAARGEIVLARKGMHLDRAEIHLVPLILRNRGSATWSGRGLHPVTVTTRWLNAAGEPLDTPVVRWPISCTIRPGREAVVQMPFRAVPFLGRFLVEFGLDQEWGGAIAVAADRLDASVVAGTQEDIDYHRLYAETDLSADHWTVVGPGSREDYVRLSKNKLELMQKVGLTPDSRVLDVGCGTGQLAEVLEGFLSDRGQYMGAELAKEGVDFCRARFKRPNFSFVQNEMTALPIQGKSFDQVVFFSVLTHTYPDESLMLLAEAKRLLAPSGLILADIFTSPTIERCAGSRGAVEMNLGLIERIVDFVGLKVEEITRHGWQHFTSRRFWKMTAKS